MEILAQYLDDVDDLVFAAAHVGGKLLRWLWRLAVSVTLAAVPVAGVLLALTSPVLGLGAVCLLLVTMLYRAVVAGATRSHRNALSNP